MADPRVEFESALMAQRVVARVMTAKADLSDQELAALSLISGLKPGPYRVRYLDEIGVTYSPTDPVIKGLVDKKFLKLQGGKAITPDRTKVYAELKLHDFPEKYRSALGMVNGHRDFKSKYDSDGE